VAIGILVAVLYLKVPINDVRSGGVTFNNYLVGTVIALISDEDVLFKSPEIIVVSMVMGILTYGIDNSLLILQLISFSWLRLIMLIS